MDEQQQWLANAIQQAEQDNAELSGISFQRIGEVLTTDLDLEAYHRLRTKLGPEARLRLAADYELYREVNETLAQLRAIARGYIDNDGSSVGPLVVRLVKAVSPPPTNWTACGYCSGSGEHAQLSKCPECRGAGYAL